MGRHISFGLLLLLIVAVNVGGGYLTSGEATATGYAIIPWLLTVILLVVCFGVIGLMPPLDDWFGVLIDQRNKISLSRLQLVAWTLLVLSAVISFGTLNAVWGKAQPLNLNIPSQLWILLGLSAGSFVAAPLVLGAKPADRLDVNAPGGHSWSDIFFGDDTANADRLDFSKVQQFFLTLVLVMVYAVSLGSILVAAKTAPADPALLFPPLDAGFIGIMAVSQTAYIAYKALPQNKTDAPNPPVVDPNPPL